MAKGKALGFRSPMGQTTSKPLPCHSVVLMLALSFGDLYSSICHTSLLYRVILRISEITLKLASTAFRAELLFSE